jgi:bifunctional DNase/RNase
LALRFGSPIYTTNEIIEKAGIIIQLETDEANEGSEEEDEDPIESYKTPLPKDDNNIQNKSIEELKVLLKDSIAHEEYEKAAKINTEIKNRKS